MKKVIITVISTLLILFILFYLYIKSGSYDISQLSQHNGFTKWMIRVTTKNSIDKRMGDNVVPSNLADTALLITGFKEYNEACVQCHGAPGVNETGMSKGLYPKPPRIYKHKDEDPQEFFWIIKNGIKMTSMPAYGPSENDQTLWAITAFVTNKLPKMSAEEYKNWSTKYHEEDEDDEHHE